MAQSRSEGGLKTAGLSLEGWYDRGDIDLAQFSSLGNDGSAMIAPAGQTAGDVAYVVPYAANAWEPGASVGELMAFTFAGEGDGEVCGPRCSTCGRGSAADVTVARRQLGAVAAGRRLSLAARCRERGHRDAHGNAAQFSKRWRGHYRPGGRNADRDGATPNQCFGRGGSSVVGVGA